MPSSRWLSLNKLSGIFIGFLSHMVLYGHVFCYTGPFLHIMVSSFMFLCLVCMRFLYFFSFLKIFCMLAFFFSKERERKGMKLGG